MNTSKEQYIAQKGPQTFKISSTCLPPSPQTGPENPADRTTTLPTWTTNNNNTNTNNKEEHKNQKTLLVVTKNNFQTKNQT